MKLQRIRSTKGVKKNKHDSYTKHLNNAYSKRKELSQRFNYPTQTRMARLKFQTIDDHDPTDIYADYFNLLIRIQVFSIESRVLLESNLAISLPGNIKVIAFETKEASGRDDAIPMMAVFSPHERNRPFLPSFHDLRSSWKTFSPQENFTNLPTLHPWPRYSPCWARESSRIYEFASTRDAIKRRDFSSP